jgi:hypothetical protein
VIDFGVPGRQLTRARLDVLRLKAGGSNGPLSLRWPNLGRWREDMTSFVGCPKLQDRPQRKSEDLSIAGRRCDISPFKKTILSVLQDRVFRTAEDLRRGTGRHFVWKFQVVVEGVCHTYSALTNQFLSDGP